MTKIKKGFVNVNDIEKLYQDLIDDKAMIGLIPNCNFETFKTILGFSEQVTAIKWEDFRMKINGMRWVNADQTATKAKMNSLYTEAQKLIYVGKAEQANDLLFKATRLEKTLEGY